MAGQETPIGHITNGVHLGTWLDPALAELLRFSGVRPEAPPEEANWDAARDAPPEAVWRVHAAAKARLAERAGIDRDRLTIGFARRFATYKRAGLVFSDVERLLALPVQIVVAGKAHPADAQGKDVMQEIVALARDRRAQGRIVFLENYDMGVARALVRGCDVWLNTPRRPLEASGTSGMKAAVNGVLNLSVLDGWWAEGYSPDVGWAIDGASDEADREQLYRLLEEQVVPTYTDNRGRWIEMMKESIAQLAPRFSMQRAVIDYVERYYLPAHARPPLGRTPSTSAGRDGDRRERGEQSAHHEHHDAHPERRIELGSDAQLGCHSSGSVGVHDDGAPAAVLRLPLERLLAGPARGGSPEVLVAGRRRRRIARRCTYVRVLADVGDDRAFDVAEVLVDVGVPGDAHEDVAVALAADADVAEDRPRSALGAAEVHVGAIGDDGVRRCGEILAR